MPMRIARPHAPAGRKALPKSAGLGYRWDPAIFEKVFKQFGIGDREALLKVAVALDDGDRTLDEKELTAAAQQRMAKTMRGYRWSDTDALETLAQAGRIEEHALLRAAVDLDGGDKVL